MSVAKNLICDHFSKVIKRSAYVEKNVITICWYEICDELTTWLIESIISSTSNKVKSIEKTLNLKNLSSVRDSELSTSWSFDWMKDKLDISNSSFFVTCRISSIDREKLDIKIKLAIRTTSDWIIDTKLDFIDVELELKLLVNFSNLNDLKNSLNLNFEFCLRTTTTFLIVSWTTIVIFFASNFIKSIFNSFSTLTNKIFCLWYKFSMIK